MITLIVTHLSKKLRRNYINIGDYNGHQKFIDDFQQIFKKVRFLR